MADQTPDFVMRVSGQKGPGGYINPGKRVLKENGFVELHGAGAATSVAVIAAERLINYGYGALERLETMRLENSNTSKVVVRLTKAAGFDEAEQKWTKEQQSSS